MKISIDNYIYIYRVTLADRTVIHKVGVSSHKNMIVRLLEINRGFFEKYRYIPECRCKKYRLVKDAYKVEKMIHKELDRYIFEKPFSGSTEVFTNSYEVVLECYEDKIS